VIYGTDRKGCGKKQRDHVVMLRVYPQLESRSLDYSTPTITNPIYIFPLQETCIDRAEVTSRYKKYYPPIPAGLRGIGDGLVTDNLIRLRLNLFSGNGSMTKFFFALRGFHFYP